MEKGKWYEIKKDGYKCASGTPYFGAMRLGTENKLIVHFDGGGASWNDVSARRPDDLYNSFVKPISVLDERKGMYSLEEKNPFRDWNVINICYASGDFHVGNGEFLYTNEAGEEKILYHHGFRNFQMVMEEVMKYMPNHPEQLLIFGESAGGFAAAALAGEVAEMFPHCKDVTCLVDGAMIIAEMRDVVENIWKAPEQFYLPVTSDNVTVDWLAGHYKTYGNRMRYLFISSTRDAVLTYFQAAFEKNNLGHTKEGGIKYQQSMKEMCERLQREVPGIGICIYDFPANGLPTEEELTKHTILVEDLVFNKLRTDDVSPLEWIVDALQGHVKSYGLELL